jgi:glucose dehydrogenase
VSRSLLLFAYWRAYPSPALSLERRTASGRTYGGDLGNTRYAPLGQIDSLNFNKLEVAWRFKTESLGPRPEYQYEGTLLMMKGRLYVVSDCRPAKVVEEKIRNSGFTPLPTW